MLKVLFICLSFLISTSVFANDAQGVIENIIDNSEISCFKDHPEETIFVHSSREAVFFETQSCIVKINYYEFNDIERLELLRKTKWICSPAGAGQKSKCYKVKKK